MKRSWGLGIALVVALGMSGRGTIASGQVGGAATTAPSGALSPDPQQAGNAGGVGLQATPDGTGTEELTARTIPPPPRSGRFGRVTTTQKQVIGGSPSRGVARFGGGAGPGTMMGANRQLRPFAARAARAPGSPRDPRVPDGSSYQDLPRPATPPTATVRSTTHNYYPTLRRAQGPNANAPSTQVRTGRAGMGAGTGMMMNGMMGGAQGQRSRGGQAAPASSNRGPAAGRR
jgi:hypothetical protein